MSRHSQQGHEPGASARREAEETARREAEETARREAEETARREAEETARREAEETARREAEETARREAEAPSVASATDGQAGPQTIVDPRPLMPSDAAGDGAVKSPTDQAADPAAPVRLGVEADLHRPPLVDGAVLNPHHLMMQAEHPRVSPEQMIEAVVLHVQSERRPVAVADLARVLRESEDDVRRAARTSDRLHYDNGVVRLAA